MSVQNYSWRARHELFTGQSGTGKTTLFLEMLRKEKARWKFVFDAKGGEIAARFKLPAATTIEELERLAGREGWVCFNPVKEFPGRFKDGFAFFCDFVWTVASEFKGRKILATDELQNWTHKHKPTPEFQVILDAGRSFTLDTFSVSSRPNGIYCDARSQITKVHAFRQVDGQATEFLKEAGINEDEVRTLRDGEYIWRNLNTGEAGKGGKAF